MLTRKQSRCCIRKSPESDTVLASRHAEEARHGVSLAMQAAKRIARHRLDVVDADATGKYESGHEKRDERPSRSRECVAADSAEEARHRYFTTVNRPIR